MYPIISMRADLAEDGLSVPASKSFKDYDTQVDVTYITAEELEGATQGDDPADTDDHPFAYVELKDGRSFYFISADLDFDYGQKTANQIYSILDAHGIQYEVVEIFDGLRVLSFPVATFDEAERRGER